MHYHITLLPNEQLINVKLEFIANIDTHLLKLPTWIPGSYMIREFSKNIVWLRIGEVVGHDANLKQISKNSWQISNLAVGQKITIEYQIFANDFGIRSAYLDGCRAFLNNTSICLYVPEFEFAEHFLEFTNLPSSWQIATSLDRIANNKFKAINYGELIDSPLELGIFQKLEFIVGTVQHSLVLSGIISDFDRKRLIKDITAICSYHINLFGKVAPFTNYLFLLHLSGDVYTGLEHASSTALMAPSYSLPIVDNEAKTVNDDYLKLLGLISHEYFHAWNVKRIKPKVFTRYNLDTENYTRLLWWFEGVTSYYDDLALVKVGIIDKVRYLELVVNNINEVYQYNGVNEQTLADSSFNAWIKYYRPDANSPNSMVSYYVKGAIVAMCLDLLIRKESAGKYSLDTVMLALWQKYCDEQVGIDEDELIELVCKNLDSKTSLVKWVHSCDKLPLAELLQDFGIEMSSIRPSNYASKGRVITDGVSNQEEEKSTIAIMLGCKTIKEQLGYTIQNIYANSNASLSELIPGDLIIALNGTKLTNLEKQLSLCKNLESVDITIFRRDNLLTLNVQLRILPTPKVVDFILADVTKLAKWL